jgi:hypothetical protein
MTALPQNRTAKRLALHSIHLPSSPIAVFAATGEIPPYPLPRPEQQMAPDTRLETPRRTRSAAVLRRQDGRPGPDRGVGDAVKLVIAIGVLWLVAVGSEATWAQLLCSFAAGICTGITVHRRLH